MQTGGFSVSSRLQSSRLIGHQSVPRILPKFPPPTGNPIRPISGPLHCQPQPQTLWDTSDGCECFPIYSAQRLASQTVLRRPETSLLLVGCRLGSPQAISGPRWTMEEEGGCKTPCPHQAPTSWTYTVCSAMCSVLFNHRDPRSHENHYDFANGESKAREGAPPGDHSQGMEL